MHTIQAKVLRLMDVEEISGLALREIAKKIGETGSPQKIKHHLDQLAAKGLITIDKKQGTIEKVRSGLVNNSNLISLPILGSANCGQATFFADDHIEGYLKVTKTILGDLMNKVKSLFVLRAVGSSMNRSRIDGNAIEDGDYVIIDQEQKVPQDGDYVVSIIDNVANIKKTFLDNKNQQIVLVSESHQDLPPIYIHSDDLDKYLIAGKVVKVMKQPDELAGWQDMAMADAVKDLEPMSDEEVEYYNNPENFKKYAQ